MRPARIADRIASATRAGRRMASKLYRHAQRVSVIGLWEETLLTLSVQALPMLLCAVIGFAGMSLVGVALTTGLVPEHHWRFGTLVIDANLRRAQPWMIVPAVVGLLLSALARGLVTWFALNRGYGSWGSAWRAVTLRLLALLLGSLAYSLLITSVLVGLNHIVLGLEPMPFDMISTPMTVDGFLQQSLKRLIRSLVPDPGLPFTDALRYVPALTSRVYCGELVSNLASLEYNVCGSQEPTVTNELQVRHIIVGCAAMILFAEVLLRFRTTAVIADGKGVAGGLLALVRSIVLSKRHAGMIFLHAVGLRLAGVAITLIFVGAPMLASQMLLVRHILPAFEGDRSLVFWISAVLMQVGAAVVGAILTAFTAYDARLYAALAARSHDQLARPNSADAAAVLDAAPATEVTEIRLTE